MGKDKKGRMPWCLALIVTSVLIIQLCLQRSELQEPEEFGSINFVQEPDDAADLQLPAPFREALVLSIDPAGYKITEAALKAKGVQAEMVRGFNGKDPKELDESFDLLTKYGNTAAIHTTVNNWLMCMHTSPGHLPHFSAANSEFWHNLLRSAPKNLTELLKRDRHNCVPKIIAIAAAHIRLWEQLAEGQLPKRTDLQDKGENPWYLVMEEDVDLCRKWRRRMNEELPLVPADADVVKLFFFGHWRKEDAAPAVNISGKMTPSPFLLAQNPLNQVEIVKAGAYKVLHGGGWSSVPIAAFYAGNQAYLIRPSGAKKLLRNIHGKPFQDVDMTIMLSSKTYVWRKVLAHPRPDNVNPDQAKLLQAGSKAGPSCNAEPPSNQFR